MLSDNPISRKEDDKFQRYPFAERVSRIISEYQPNDSLTIGLYGKWGEGKSTVINFVEHNLRSSENLITVKFNPWLFSSEQQLLQSFFEILAQALKKSLKSKNEKLVTLINQYADLLETLGAITGVPHSKSILSVFKSIFPKKTIEEVKAKVDQLLQKSSMKIVIFMDDIDRLKISEIQDIFRLVKLTADFKNTLYVLAFDDDLVAKSLDSQYAKGGHEFLEKIIQVPLNIPLARKSQLKNYTLNALNNILDHNHVSPSDDEGYRFIQFFDKYLLPYIDTPRISIRLSNSLIFLLPLLKNEVNTVDLILMECIKSLAPALYNDIRENGNILIKKYDSNSQYGYSRVEEEKNQAKHKIESLGTVNCFENDHIIKILKELFPQTKSIFETNYINDHDRKEWYEQMRICSPRHFDRYFSFSVSSDDISEVKYKNLIEELSSKDFRNDQVHLRQLFSDLNIDELVLKFQFLEDQIDPNQTNLICQNLAQLGDLFPNERGFFIYGIYTQMAAYLGRLTEKNEHESRIDLAKKILEKAQPIDFGWEIWRYLQVREKSPTVTALSEIEKIELGLIILDRTKKKYDTQSLFEEIGETNLMHLLIFWGKQNYSETSKTIGNFIEEGSSNFMKLLDIFSTTITSSNHPEPYKAGFGQSYYDSLRQVIDLSKMYKLSIQYFGNQNPPINMTDRDPISQEELIGWFQMIYRKNSGNT
ncbi:KAP family P-loop NTPase fold protein [Reichenbachiella sp.]|uniref:KAP family P-loop NTPase fold protein n=1 Tax=Reichenbachiella sp. TaxID=2184521 RepID=UPI003BAFD1DE